MVTLQHTRAQGRREPLAWGAAQVVVLGAVAAGVGLGVVGWVVGVGFAVAVVVLLLRAMAGHGVDGLGPADRITLFRALLVGGVTAMVVDGRAGSMVIVGVATAALVLDFVDGQVARRTGTATPLGARFDMEVDAFLILVLSVQVATQVGAWVLVIGGARYLFVAASWRWRWLRGDLPPSVARKTVAAVQGVVLVVAASGIVPHAAVLVAIALAALLWSFGRDIVRLRRACPAVVEGSRHD